MRGPLLVSQKTGKTIGPYEVQLDWGLIPFSDQMMQTVNLLQIYEGPPFSVSKDWEDHRSLRSSVGLGPHPIFRSNDANGQSLANL